MKRATRKTSEELGAGIDPRVRGFLDRIAEAAVADVLREMEAQKGRRAA